MPNLTEKRSFEIWWPRIVAVVAAVAGFALMRRFGWMFDLRNPQFLEAMVTLGAVIAGFIATNFSLVVSFKSELMGRIKRTLYYGLLIDYLCSVLYLSLFMALCGMLGLLFIDWIPKSGMLLHTLGAAGLGLLCWTLCCFLRAFRISVMIFKRVDDEEKD